ncbi:hypothetical protein WJX79_000626 [Trebouxia sp. C0005]
MPRLPASDLSALKAFPPRTLPDIIALRDLMKQYAASFPVQVTIGYCLVYIFMQTFAVPGTLSLSLLSGALYGALPGLLLVSVISTMGATACYGMSWACGKALVYALWPDKLGHFGAEVRKRQGNLLSYVILLRATPVLPNTFINVASPMVDLPLPPFMLGTLIGCLPNNFVAVSAGSRLGELVSLRDLYDRRLLLLGLGVSFMALLPIVLKNVNAMPQTAEAEAKTLKRKQQ